MTRYLVPGISLALATVGLFCRLAFGGEGSSAIASSNIWETVLTVYGPMGGMLVWFMHREKTRDKKLYDLLEKCTEAMTTVANRLSTFQADSEKTRAAVYQVKDVVLERMRAREDARAGLQE